jgi:hypothetical protein
MARQPQAKPSQAKKKRRPPVEPFHLDRRNLYMLAGGLASIVLGYVLLGAGSITAAPFFLVLGYCFLVPLSLFWRPRRPRETVPRS